MNHTDSLIENTPLADCTVGELLQVLASDAVLPGAGAAAGIALALAAACAGKAVAITLCHPGQNKETAITLENLQTRFSELADTALRLARDDALQFKRQLKAENNENETKDLIETDRKIMSTCRKLNDLLNHNEHLIAENMKGDWLAASALCKACQDIHTENLNELEKSEESRGQRNN